MDHKFAIKFFSLLLNLLLKIKYTLIFLKVKAFYLLRPPLILLLFKHNLFTTLLFSLFSLFKEFYFFLESHIILLFNFAQLISFPRSLHYLFLGPHHLCLEQPDPIFQQWTIPLNLSSNALSLTKCQLFLTQFHYIVGDRWQYRRF